IIVAGGANQTITSSGYAIDASALNTGSIKVSTDINGVLDTGAAGIVADNHAQAIPAAANSTISVTNAGMINSGAGLNPAGLSCCVAEGAADGLAPAGILAGYSAVSFNPNATGANYQQCSKFGCATMMPTGNVNGTVNIINNGPINAEGG